MSRELIEESAFRKRIMLHQVWNDVNLSEDKSEESAQMVLTETDIKDMLICNADFSGAEIVRCNVSSVTFKECYFSYALLLESVFNNCSFDHCNFVKADLRGIKCNDCSMNNCDFTRADLTDATLAGVNLTGSKFNWSWLVNTDLRFALLEAVEFEEAKLIQTKLYNERRFVLGSIDKALVDRADISPEGNGGEMMGKEVFELLSK